MMFGPSDNRAVTCVADSLARHNVSHQVFNGHEANKRYPNQFKIPDNYSCVFEEKGGILQAQKAVAAFQVHNIHTCLYMYQKLHNYHTPILITKSQYFVIENCSCHTITYAHTLNTITCMVHVCFLL